MNISSVSPFSQAYAACRCEWGTLGHDALAPADVVIIVDVLSFSTCVDVAVSRGVLIFPIEGNNDSAKEFARNHQAELAGRRGQARYSLSPASFLDAPAGLRCVLPSWNGASLTLRAAATPATVLSGCLRNASAIAKAAAKIGATFNVCPAGEKWPDGSLRPSLEDWVGAGAILRELPGTKSSEALAAIDAFEASRGNLLAALMSCGSGRELKEKGYETDIELAAQLDASEVIPRLAGKAFINAAS